MHDHSDEHRLQHPIVIYAFASKCKRKSLDCSAQREQRRRVRQVIPHTSTEAAARREQQSATACDGAQRGDAEPGRRAAASSRTTRGAELRHWVGGRKTQNRLERGTLPRPPSKTQTTSRPKPHALYSQVALKKKLTDPYVVG
jgi:hypothetical protein